MRTSFQVLTSALLLTVSVQLCGGEILKNSAPEKNGPAAPEVKPELLMVARAGGAGDQWMRQVSVQGNRVIALGESDFSLQVTINGDNTVKGTLSGNAAAEHKNVNRGTNHVKIAKMGPLTYGYKQVAPLLQQPYMNGPGWSLWGWTEEQCKKAKGTYAPFMADSGISYAEQSPHNTFFASSYCDGGNTSLRVDPRNIDKDLKFPISHGGGGGKSAFCFEISPQGQLLRQMVFRGWVNDVCWDEFQRPIVVGAAVLKAGQAPNKMGYGDGAGIAMADADWSKLLFGTHIGSAESSGEKSGDKSGEKAGDKSEYVFWNVAIDSKTGICAAVGYVSGDLKQLHPVQDSPGGGTDGLLVIFRLWKPEAYSAIKGSSGKSKVLPF
jgi:hypothetical protein